MSALAEMLQSPEKNQFSEILKHAPAGLALCQSPGNLTSTNSTFEELLGLSSNQIPCALPELIQDGNRSRRLIAELFQGTRESFQTECAAWGAESKLLRWTVWAVHGEGNGTDRAVVMIEDLSGMAMARQRLQQAER